MAVTKKDREILKFVEKYGSLSINQAAHMFFPQNQHSYKYSLVKLKQLRDRELINAIHDPILDEHLYYFDKPPTAHSNALLNFYSNMIRFKRRITSFEREKQFDNGKVRADDFIVWDGEYGTQIAILEVDLYHNTDIKKYERIYDDVVDTYGDFPYLIILSLMPRSVTSDKITIINMDLKCSDFMQKVLPL
jgi:hypothetical protein